MKNLLRLLPCFVFALVSLRAADLPAKASATEGDKIIAAVKAADAERVAATKAGDGPRLEAIYSDALRYAHSSGHVDTKASYLQALTSHATVYETYNYQEQNFSVVAPSIVLMTGRVLINTRSASGVNELDLNFLGVWREENGKWRFLAWQSCRNPPPAPAAAAKK